MWDSVPVSKLSDLPQAMVDDHEVIGVDEGQFFPDVVEWCDKQANRHGKHVIVAGNCLRAEKTTVRCFLNLSSCALRLRSTRRLVSTQTVWSYRRGMRDTNPAFEILAR